MRYELVVHETVKLWVEVEADSKSEARRKAADPSKWADWEEVPVVLDVRVQPDAAKEIG